MTDLTNSIAKQFDATILSELQISTLVEWLQKTPTTTTIRINLLRTSFEEVKAHILNVLEKYEYLPILPKIEAFEPIPEMMLIQGIDEKFINWQPFSQCKEVIVDAACGAAVLRGSHIYSPGVIAMQSNTKIDEVVNIFVDIEGLCRKGTNVVYKSSQKRFIGSGQVKMQRFQLFSTDNCPRGIAVEVHNTISCVPSIGSEYLKDQFAILQNFPSIACGKVLNPKPNEYVLDMCASPGNKTTHLAQLMEDTGILIAMDKSNKRVLLLEENIRRFKFECVSCYTFDATKAISKMPVDNSKIQPPFAEETFDKILLDAPCSGLGNRPVLLAKMSQKTIDSFPILQKKLLDTAIKLLKVGGTLVYSTCSILAAENELNVTWFLAKYFGKVELETATPLFGGPGLSNTGLNDAQRRMVQRFGPYLEENNKQKQLIDSTGFFICKFKKTSKL